jgi:hypothetical protein
MTEYDKLKEPGTIFFRSWEKINGAQVFVNGYLLEPWEDKDTYKPLLISLVGKKGRIDDFIQRYLKEAELMLPEPDLIEYRKGRANCYRVLPFFAREKRGALQRESVHIDGTLEYQVVVYRKEILESSLSSHHIKAYLVGVDEADAQLGFTRLLRNTTIPCPPEWIEPLKAALLRHHGWLVKLAGHQMTGYKANIPKHELEMLVKEMVKSGELPRPSRQAA